VTDTAENRSDAQLPIQARGHKWLDLIYALAQDEVDYTRLSMHYQIRKTDLALFAEQHAAAIEDAKTQVNDEFAALWITKKTSRMAEYQADLEYLNDCIETADKPLEAIRLKQQVLKNVADELGQIPGRTPTLVQNNSVHYHVEGVDMEKLQIAAKGDKKSNAVIDAEVIEDGE